MFPALMLQGTRGYLVHLDVHVHVHVPGTWYETAVELMFHPAT